MAQYSYGKDALEKLLGSDFRVDLLSHAAMMPTDLLHYKRRILAMRPAVIVYPVNTVDFDIERLTPPWEAGPLRSRIMEESYLSLRLPARMYPIQEVQRGCSRGLLTAAHCCSGRRSIHCGIRTISGCHSRSLRWPGILTRECAAT